MDGRHRPLETGGGIGGAGGSVGGIAAGADTGAGRTAAAELIEGEGAHPPADAPALMGGIDGHEADLADMVRSVEPGFDETGDLRIEAGEVDAGVRVPGRPAADLVGMVLAPARVVDTEERRSEDRREAFVDRREGGEADREDPVVVLARVGAEEERQPTSFWAAPGR